VLRIFIAVKNPSLWPGSNPQPLDLVASTLTTTPPRRLIAAILKPVATDGAVLTSPHLNTELVSLVM
jgi:hypothetical protein